MIAADQADAAGIGEAPPGALVGYKLDGAEQPDRPNLADKWMMGEFRQHLRERRTGIFPDARNELLPFHDLQVLEGDGATHGVAREGVAVVKIVIMSHERIADHVVDDNA